MDEKTPDSGGTPPGGAPRTPPPGEAASLVDQFVRNYRGQLLALATRMVGRNHAEDVAQEAFVRLAERLVQRPLPEVMALLRSPTDLCRLMYRITACRAFDHLRRRTTRLGVLSSDAVDVDMPDADARQHLQATLDVERVERAYASLTPMQRITHVLHFYYGFTDSDFELTLGLSKTNSRTLVSRANRALRRALERKS